MKDEADAPLQNSRWIQSASSEVRRKTRSGALPVPTNVMLILAALLTCASTTHAQVRPGRVGVIKLALVYDNLKETINSEKALADQEQQLAAMTESHRTQLKQMNDRIADAKSHNASDRAGVVDETDRQTFEFQLQQQIAQTKIVRARIRQMIKGFNEIQSAVNDMAASGGFDLVIVDHGQPVPPNVADLTDTRTVAGVLLNRNLLGNSDAVDITNDVIQTLNKNFKGPEIPSTMPALAVTSMRIGLKTFQIEIASDNPSRERGLMERDTLPPDHGMIFVFAAAQEQTFWMHHTRFPLDNVYVDAHNRVSSVKTMKAYDETPIPSDGEAKYVIELAAGAASGVKIGDQIDIPAMVDKSLK